MAYGTMISYFIVLVYRQIKVESLFGYKANSKKMYLICIFLMIVSVIASLGSKFFYIVAVIFMVISLFLFKEECKIVINHITTIVGRKRR